MQKEKKKKTLLGWVSADLRGHNGMSLHLTVSLFIAGLCFSRLGLRQAACLHWKGLQVFGSCWTKCSGSVGLDEIAHKRQPWRQDTICGSLLITDVGGGFVRDHQWFTFPYFIPQFHFHEWDFNDYGKMLCKRWAYQPRRWCSMSSMHWTSACK